VFSKCAGPYGRLGPARYRPTPLTIEQLPPIDYVLVSHNHYDHLDAVSVEAIAAANPDAVWFVPLGLRVP